jgi:glycosyltransferase involved in cell wall biosynthesis
MKNKEINKIIGILLVRNEDIFIERIITNIMDFCDVIIVADNQSVDKTAEIVLSLRDKFNKVKYHFVDHPSLSHDLISGYANSLTWIFAVDGDELYDRFGLATLRRKILAGEYLDRWMIFGNVLHCIKLNLSEQYARGYLSPPCRSMTKLYNFQRIISWDGPCPERLHGGTIVFQPEYSNEDRLLLYEKMHWDSSFFRCLHLCFLPRSSMDRVKFGKLIQRKNISEKNSLLPSNKLLSLFSWLMGDPKGSRYKRNKYMRGTLVKKDTRPFFSSCV